MRSVSSPVRLNPLLAALLLACGGELPIDGEDPGGERSAQAAGDPVFDWPLGGTQGGERVPGWDIRVVQNYANRGDSEWFESRAHTGIDLAFNTGITAGAPVHAAAAGVVRCVAYADFPGWVLVVEHTMGDGGKRYTQYGHLNQPTIANNTPVAKGQQIATILDQADESHLHFEVRSWLYYKDNTADCVGPGYAEGTSEPGAHNWIHPIDWHYGHRPPFPGQGVSDTAQNVRSAPSLSAGSLVKLTPGARYTVDQVTKDQGGGKEWWYRVQYAAGSWGWAAGYANHGWGGEIYLVEPDRAGGGTGGGADDAKINEGSSIVPAFFMPGQIRRIEIRAKNVGTSTWTAGGAAPYRLASGSDNAVAWVGFPQCGGYQSGTPANARVELCQSVAPTTSNRFQLDARAPTSGATGRLTARMMHETIAPFGEVQRWDLHLGQPGCGTACTQCVVDARPDILPFYAGYGWDTSCGNRNNIISDWCRISPSDCNAVKTSTCATFCNSCRCSGGTHLGGTPIPGNTTFCGYRVCGEDRSIYECSGSTWVDLHLPCQ